MREPKWGVIEGDCIEIMRIMNRDVKLIFADAPYNQGVDYGEGPKADRMSYDQFYQWSIGWLRLCVANLAADGSLFVMTSDDWAAEYVLTLKTLGLHMRNWIKWYEAFGANCTKKFNRCSRHILYFVKDPKRFTFNADAGAVRTKSARQAAGDKRANPEGKLFDDVWQVPRVCGTHYERVEWAPTQVPLEIMRRIIGCASNPGDLVFDPVSGSATTGVSAIEMGREYLGIELNAEYARLSRERLSKVVEGA
ncbi:MAG: site-specific DNA-methyltransferase [Planctomycetota bacterium]|nr:site-specific DNA-methyltransferase [Planctomycetota bacterium]